MKKYLSRSFLLSIVFLFCVTLNLNAAFEPEYRFGIISRIVCAVLASEHFNRQPDAVKLSSELFDEYMKTLDPNKLYFTQIDIDEFKKGISGDLYTNLTRGDVTFAFIVYNKLLEKNHARDEFAKNRIAKGFDFADNEEFLFDRTDIQWAKSESDLDAVWDKKLKNDILTFRMMDRILLADTSKSSDTSKIQDIAKTSSKLTPEERTLKRLRTYRMYLDENEPIEVLEIYLSSLSRLYDPHSSYMSPKTEDDFNVQMQLSFVGIGAFLSNEDGYVKVEKIIPGGPAEKSGNLKATDKIIAVGEEGTVPVDVVDMPINKVVDKIRGARGTKVYLTILPGVEGAMAVPKVISIMRDTVELKDSEASSEIKEIKSPSGKMKRIGIITLPSFYLDFQGAYNGEKDYKSSTRDVKKILETFKKDKVDGIIVDIRSNGGGSLKEAIDLTGLFIGKKPIVQTKDSRSNIRIEEDEDEPMIYEGPLMVLTNRLSASASEIFAGAIQDYGRGLVIGDKSTHGKGTVQTVLDLSNLLSRFNMDLNAGAIKLTNAKFYRVSGSSTQNKGVTPDIEFESFLDYMELGENNLDKALPWDSVNPVEHEVFNDKIKDSLPYLQKRTEERQKQSADFNKLDKAIDLYAKVSERKTVPLNEEKRWQMYQDEKRILDEQKDFAESLIPEGMSADTDKSKGKDIYLGESINIFIDYLDFLNEYKASVKELANN
ncbi:MAG TPA: tail-specific protease [Lentisphaeria bacterium]|nr:MAG: hypothetical protein A2X47_06910 [Lentisphaerae bacterium GWF2_38_69]HBM15794.1 tail-specific protease [Lentisphaeria bacterium]